MSDELIGLSFIWSLAMAVWGLCNLILALLERRGGHE